MKTECSFEYDNKPERTSANESGAPTGSGIAGDALYKLTH